MMIDLEKLNNMKEVSTEDLVRMGMQIREHVRNMESAKNVINAEIADRFELNPSMYGTGIVVDEITAKVQTRVTFKTSLAQARDLGAIKDAVDTDKLKALDKSGAEVPGKTTTKYVVIERMGGDEA